MTLRDNRKNGIFADGKKWATGLEVRGERTGRLASPGTRKGQLLGHRPDVKHVKYASVSVP